MLNCNGIPHQNKHCLHKHNVFLKQNYCINVLVFTEFQCTYNVRILMVIDLDDKELMTSALNTGAALGTASIRYYKLMSPIMR